MSWKWQFIAYHYCWLELKTRWRWLAGTGDGWWGGRLRAGAATDDVWLAGWLTGCNCCWCLGHCVCCGNRYYTLIQVIWAEESSYLPQPLHWDESYTRTNEKKYQTLCNRRWPWYRYSYWYPSIVQKSGAASGSFSFPQLCLCTPTEASIESHSATNEKW